MQCLTLYECKISVSDDAKWQVFEIIFCVQSYEVSESQCKEDLLMDVIPYNLQQLIFTFKEKKKATSMATSHLLFPAWCALG